MKIIKIFVASVVAVLSLASCKESSPPMMLWEVTATPSENVKAVFDPSFYHQIQIAADGKSSEVTLKCKNYKTLVLTGVKSQKDNGEFRDTECKFSAKVVEPGVIKITLEEMPAGFTETKSILQIDGSEGKDSNTTTVDIIRNS